MDKDIQNVDWSKLRAMTRPERIPQLLDQLMLVNSHEEGWLIELKLDNKFQVQDALYESAYYVVKYIFFHFKKIKPSAMGNVLSVVNNICCGKPSATELKFHNTDIVEKCIIEIDRHFSKLIDVFLNNNDFIACLNTIELIALCYDMYEHRFDEIEFCIQYCYLKSAEEFEIERKINKKILKLKMSPKMALCKEYSENWSIDLF
jgi:hypothetical protein